MLFAFTRKVVHFLRVMNDGEGEKNKNLGKWCAHTWGRRDYSLRTRSNSLRSKSNYLRAKSNYLWGRKNYLWATQHNSPFLSTTLVRATSRAYTTRHSYFFLHFLHLTHRRAAFFLTIRGVGEGFLLWKSFTRNVLKNREKDAVVKDWRIKTTPIVWNMRAREASISRNHRRVWQDVNFVLKWAGSGKNRGRDVYI